jgi:hypothetical protein
VESHFLLEVTANDEEVGESPKITLFSYDKCQIARFCFNPLRTEVYFRHSIQTA